MFIANDLNQFKTLFVNKLKAMLADDELGAFILVLANSHQDEFLQKELSEDLKKTFLALKDNFLAGSLKAPQDDIDVFKKLLEIELDDIPVWKHKTIGDWEIVCNSMRQLRPARASAQVLTSIKQPFDETRFHFNKPFLKPEILWQGIFKEVESRVLFNKFPFAGYHLLIVPEPEANSSQLLTQKMHQYAFSLVDEMADILSGFGIGFNSLAAGASVNHFHFQGFIREQDFAIEKNHWSHNAGVKEYPVQVKRFSDAETAWHFIDQLTSQDEAFNCLYLGRYCYVIPRKYQDAAELPDWLAGAGWIDVAGTMTVSDSDTFNTVDEAAVTQALALL